MTANQKKMSYYHDKNEKVRAKLFLFKAKHYQPSNRVLADCIGVNYENFLKWQRNQLDYGYDSLLKVEYFIDNADNDSKEQQVDRAYYDALQEVVNSVVNPNQ